MAAARSRSGLTLFETLVMIAITALIGAVVLNVGARANAGNFGRAERIAAAQSLQIAEEDLRRAARDAGAIGGAVDVNGDANSVSFGVLGLESCGLSRIEAKFAIRSNGEGGALVRRCSGRAPVVIARWPAGARGDFAYSADGIAWRSSFTAGAGPDGAPQRSIFVRMRLIGPGPAERTFIVRANAANAEIGVDEATETVVAP
jgi:hypothetical protein